MSDPVALPIKRLPKQTLHHVWAPKLGRIVLLAGNDQLRLWTMLEAHPQVSKYCERPTWPDAQDASANLDFWALKDGQQLQLVLTGSPAGIPIGGVPPARGAIDIVSSAALDEHRIWILNWLSLLPYIGSQAALGLDSLAAAIVAAVVGEISIGEVTDQFTHVEALAVRTCIVLALHRGLIASEDLRHRPWGASTRLRPVTSRRPHAAW